MTTILLLHFLFDVQEFSYDEIEIYKIEGYYSGDDYYLYDTNEYAIKYAEEQINYINSVNPGSDKDKFINKIAADNNKKIISVKDDSAIAIDQSRYDEDNNAENKNENETENNTENNWQLIGGEGESI